MTHRTKKAFAQLDPMRGRAPAEPSATDPILQSILGAGPARPGQESDTAQGAWPVADVAALPARRARRRSAARPVHGLARRPRRWPVVVAAAAAAAVLAAGVGLAVRFAGGGGIDNGVADQVPTTPVTFPSSGVSALAAAPSSGASPTATATECAPKLTDGRFTYPCGQAGPETMEILKREVLADATADKVCSTDRKHCEGKSIVLSGVDAVHEWSYALATDPEGDFTWEIGSPLVNVGQGGVAKTTPGESQFSVVDARYGMLETGFACDAEMRTRGACPSALAAAASPVPATVVVGRAGPDVKSIDVGLMKLTNEEADSVGPEVEATVRDGWWMAVLPVDATAVMVTAAASGPASSTIVTVPKYASAADFTPTGLIDID